MTLSNKNFIIFYLIVALAGIFVFHWFFVNKTMSATECSSINCAYSAPQAMPTESQYILLAVLLIAIFASALLSLFLFNDKFKELLCGFDARKERIDVFDYKLNSWLKILEKRDPLNALTVARI